MNGEEGASRRTLRSGGDVGIVSTGLGTQWALEAADLLETQGVSVSLLHAPTLKPFRNTSSGRVECGRMLFSAHAREASET